MTLGGLLAAVAPPRLLKAGIVVMAVIDTVLVDFGPPPGAERRTQRRNSRVAGLPQLQRVLFGQAVMGYGDIFIAAALGAVLASAWPTQRRAAVLTGALAVAFDLLFLAVPELPATVPVAAALIVVELSTRVTAPKIAGVRRLTGIG